MIKGKECYLSKSEISSFCGNVLPLRLISYRDISKEHILWEIEGDSVTIQEFSEEKDGFSDGVLLTLVKEGEALVSAWYQGEKYSCKVYVEKAQKAETEDELRYYLADLHIHTTKEHNRERFMTRTEELPRECVHQISEEGILDCSVITDHGGPMRCREFFQGFIDEEIVQHDGLVVFPGCESSVNPIINDRYGIPRKYFGEIITLNSNNFAVTNNIEGFYKAIARSPFGVGILVHPQIVGWDACGVWVSAVRENATPQLKDFIRLVEMGNGNATSSNLINEYIYSVALDCGFKVAPDCSSDSHGHYKPCPGKTIIMAPDKTKEYFLDALRCCRVYASESGNVKLGFTVNGYKCAETLPLSECYKFHVEMELFREDITAQIVKCQVISDYGVCIKNIECMGQTTLDFEVFSDSARYFYLRLVDAEGRKTWSAPIWTGRMFDVPEEIKELIPLDKSKFTAFDERNGKEADVLLNDNPKEAYESGSNTVSVLIDMKCEYQICGVGHISPILIRRTLMDAGIRITDKTAEFMSEYRISVSLDGSVYHECRCGVARVFGREEIYTFPMVRVRYVRLEALSSVGKASERREFENASISIAELSVFTKRI